jgi:hypothetical protein
MAFCAWSMPVQGAPALEHGHGLVPFETDPDALWLCAWA